MDRAGDRPRSELSLKNYPWITLESIWDNLPILLVGAVLFSVCCVPFIFLILVDWIFAAAITGILSVGPAWAGLLYFEGQLLQNNPGGVVNFFGGIKRYWRHGMALGLLVGIPAYANFFLLAWLESPDTPEIAWGGVFALTWILAAVASLFIYAFPLVTLHHQGVRDSMRNAAVLSSRHILNTLGMLGMAILFVFAGFTITSGLFFFLPTLFGMFMVNNTLLVIKLESE